MQSGGKRLLRLGYTIFLWIGTHTDCPCVFMVLHVPGKHDKSRDESSACVELEWFLKGAVLLVKGSATSMSFCPTLGGKFFTHFLLRRNF